MEVLIQTIEEKILAELVNQNRSIIGLAREVHVTDRHLYYVLKGKPGEKRKLSVALKTLIEEALGKEF